MLTCWHNLPLFCVQWGGCMLVFTRPLSKPVCNIVPPRTYRITYMYVKITFRERIEQRMQQDRSFFLTCSKDSRHWPWEIHAKILYDQCTSSHASRYRPINKLELAELIWLASDSLMLSPVYGYYKQTSIPMKKSVRAKSLFYPYSMQIISLITGPLTYTHLSDNWALELLINTHLIIGPCNGCVYVVWIILV